MTEKNATNSKMGNDGKNTDGSNCQDPIADDSKAALSLEEQIEELHAALAAQKALVEEHKDKYVRSVAEMDNMRKRNERERADLLKYGHEGVLQAMLPVLDGFERAVNVTVKESDPEFKVFFDGIAMVKKQLIDTLEKFGLTSIDALNKPFDPNIHQAIRKVESAEVTSETVVEEFAKGYLLHDRLVRPAMVSVAVPSGS